MAHHCRAWQSSKWVTESRGRVLVSLFVYYFVFLNFIFIYPLLLLPCFVLSSWKETRTNSDSRYVLYIHMHMYVRAYVHTYRSSSLVEQPDAEAFRCCYARDRKCAYKRPFPRRAPSTTFYLKRLLLTILVVLSFLYYYCYYKVSPQTSSARTRPQAADFPMVMQGTIISRPG